MMNAVRIRDTIRLINALLAFFLYIPHLLIFFLSTAEPRNRHGLGWRCNRALILSDIEKLKYQTGFEKLPNWVFLLSLLHNNRYYRNLFYHRIGPVKAAFISWIRPGDKYFTIGKSLKLGPGMWMAHPYSTILAADSIGENFHCVHCTTVGNTSDGRPTIGDNVHLGANVTIIGPVHIGNNVIIGAGSVVVKDIPDNSVAVGNPAKVIKKL